MSGIKFNEQYTESSFYLTEQQLADLLFKTSSAEV